MKIYMKLHIHRKVSYGKDKTLKQPHTIEGGNFSHAYGITYCRIMNKMMRV